MACVLAFGSAVPPNEFEQSEYPDFLFGVTSCNDKVELKSKFERMCNKAGVKKRHFYLTKEILDANPSMCTFDEPSLQQRLKILASEIPKLAQEAAVNAIQEWGQPESNITHVLLATTSASLEIPGPDVRLVKLLGLNSNVHRIVLHQHACFGGVAALRIAKDIAENNPGARILVACVENTSMTFRAPNEEHPEMMVGSALFGDGAAALVIGSSPTPDENPIFELHWAGQNLIPNSESAVHVHLNEAGLYVALNKSLPGFVEANVEAALVEPFQKFEVVDVNKFFWVVHPGGPAILDQVETSLKLDKKKLEASRQVLRDYGNIWSASVLLALDRIRQRQGTPDEWGFVLGFGPGLTLECILLRRI